MLEPGRRIQIAAEMIIGMPDELDLAERLSVMVIALAMLMRHEFPEPAHYEATANAVRKMLDSAPPQTSLILKEWLAWRDERKSGR